MAHPTLIGKIIHFAGKKRGTTAVTIGTGLCIKVVVGRRRGLIYHTDTGYRVPESLITKVEDSAEAAKATNEFFQKKEEARIAMHQLVGHLVEFVSRKRGAVTGRVINAGSKRLTIETANGHQWKVPPALISKVDDSPFKFE